MTQDLKDKIFESVLDNFKQFVFVQDSNGNILWCNKGFKSVLDKNSKEEIIDKQLHDVFSSSILTTIQQMNEKCLHGEKALSEIVEEDEKSILIEQSQLDNDHILTIVEDITSIVYVQNRLRRKQFKYKSLLEFTNTGYVIMDEHMEIKESNCIFSDMLSYECPECLIGKHLRSWVSAVDVPKFDKAFEKVKNEEGINNLRIHMLKRNSGAVFVSISANLIRNGKAEIFCLIKDVSEIKEQESKNFIHTEKQKDLIRQGISEVRKTLKQNMLKV